MYCQVLPPPARRAEANAPWVTGCERPRKLKEQGPPHSPLDEREGRGWVECEGRKNEKKTGFLSFWIGNGCNGAKLLFFFEGTL